MPAIDLVACEEKVFGYIGQTQELETRFQTRDYRGRGTDDTQDAGASSQQPSPQISRALLAEFCCSRFRRKL